VITVLTPNEYVVVSSGCSNSAADLGLKQQTLLTVPGGWEVDQGADRFGSLSVLFPGMQTTTILLHALGLSCIPMCTELVSLPLLTRTLTHLITLSKHKHLPKAPPPNTFLLVLGGGV
jgi:hypothetical protein